MPANDSLYLTCALVRARDAGQPARSRIFDLLGVPEAERVSEQEMNTIARQVVDRLDLPGATPLKRDANANIPNP